MCILRQESTHRGLSSNGEALLAPAAPLQDTLAIAQSFGDLRAIPVTEIWLFQTDRGCVWRHHLNPCRNSDTARGCHLHSNHQGLAGNCCPSSNSALCPVESSTSVPAAKTSSIRFCIKKSPTAQQNLQKLQSCNVFGFARSRTETGETAETLISGVGWPYFWWAWNIQERFGITKAAFHMNSICVASCTGCNITCCTCCPQVIMQIWYTWYILILA